MAAPVKRSRLARDLSVIAGVDGGAGDWMGLRFRYVIIYRRRGDGGNGFFEMRKIRAQVGW